MRIAMVDDQSADLERLREFVCRWGTERQASIAPPPALYSSGEAFLAEFSPGGFDIVFLDIYMGGVTGMDVARRVRERDGDCRLIFTTTSVDFAVDGYEVGAAGYLVKPYTYEKLRSALDRCGADLLEQSQYVTVPDKQGEQRLYLHQIAYTEFESRRVCVHGKDGALRYVPMRQADLAEMLLKYPYFCDCVRGILVNLEAVAKLTEDSFLLKDGRRIPISRLKYREVREKFLAHTYAQARGGA